MSGRHAEFISATLKKCMARHSICILKTKTWYRCWVLFNKIEDVLRGVANLHFKKQAFLGPSN